MNENIRIVQNKKQGGALTSLDTLNEKTAEKVQRWHSSFDIYQETPLAHLTNTAKELGLGDLYVKDESYRFGLNAFKVLGSSFAIGNYIAGLLGEEIDKLPFARLISQKVHDQVGELTFVTATDGNHGRGLAWTASRLRQHAIVYMPKGSSQERLDNILAEGADASITDMNYDETVRLAKSKAERENDILVQDTAWNGYEKIPAWIMQGYLTMAYEAYRQLKEQRPTHIFLQAGVGSMAGAVTGFFASLFEKEKPVITIVEPHKANCIFRTAEANDGKLHVVKGDMDTIMAGLACGEPNPAGWNVLRDYADYFISCPDSAAAKGMRILGNPAKGDTRVISGESGAAAFGCVAQIMQGRDEIREMLNLGSSSKVLCFSTEGNTDRERYREIVWNGAYSDNQ
ncbi:MAG: diaminopropionate ammonia-lyase [Intestinimonas sp.]|nr:diaminopropionate ammonia-lyase [Intestinimonas sp.]